MNNNKNHNQDQENQSIDKEKETFVSQQEGGENTESSKSELLVEEKMADLENKYLRLVAEFDNYRKRMARERMDMIMQAGEDIIKGLLPVLDDFERAMDAMKKTNDIDAVREGVDLIYNKLYKYLESKGLEQIDVVGKDLNTDEHDAVTKFPAPSLDQKGKVIDVIQHGYSLNGKVIRYAKVVVGE